MSISKFSIKQFEDRFLSHFSYAVLINDKVILIDPSRDPNPYYLFAEKNNARITGVIETHLHADFVSSHLEINQTTGAPVYISKYAQAHYPHQDFDEGDDLDFDTIKLKALNTPGHSLDSICIVLEEDGKDKVVFTGDTLFVSSCGRPDLREESGNLLSSKITLAKAMFHSLRTKIICLNDQVIVYPAHGAGSLCGSLLDAQPHSTIRIEKENNWSLKNIPEEQFVSNLIDGVPFTPKYFSATVLLNKKGADCFSKVIQKNETVMKTIVNKQDVDLLDPKTVIIDARTQDVYKEGHLRNSINLQNSPKFETWLGSIINPNEPFYLIAHTEEELLELTKRIAKIGYESQIKGLLILKYSTTKDILLNREEFEKATNLYTIIDIRNYAEVKTRPIFERAINIPLQELRERIQEIPTDKPIVVHCAIGYRSAAGASIIKNSLPPHLSVYDLGKDIVRY
ncbi:MAG: MBL fold metallo-hydrolase [Phycisphaerales bacterium]|nr:MBL fold metallo-hydrolase [Phycisphaerales bacterium]